MAKTTTDDSLREIFRSPEYLEALKTRLLSGKGVTAAEIALAKSMGLAVPEQDPDAEYRDAMRAMDKQARRLLMDLLRLAARKETAVELQVIRGGDWIGVGYSASTRSEAERQARAEWKPTPMSADEADLMPQAFPRT